ncbi:MAG: outer membrane lipoprotein-sorting protein [Halanaerobacter sp.]
MKKVITLLISLLILSSSTAYALDSNQILNKLEEKVNPKTAKMQLEIKTQNSNKLVEYYSKETEDETNTLFKVLEPNEEEGTAVLALDKRESEELYFYIQAIGARKVAVNQKKGSFLQTEYNYFEILDLVEGNYNQKFKSTVKNKKEGFLLKLEPNNRLNQYDYLLLYLTEEYLPQKLEFYNKNRKYKVWEVEEMGKNKGFYFPKKSRIVNLDNNNQTEIRFKNVKYNLAVDDLYFSVRYLRR